MVFRRISWPQMKVCQELSCRDIWELFMILGFRQSSLSRSPRIYDASQLLEPTPVKMISVSGPKEGLMSLEALFQTAG